MAKGTINMDYSGMILARWGLNWINLPRMSNDAIRAYVLSHPNAAQGAAQCEYITAKAIAYRGKEPAVTGREEGCF
jgi:hypothetical protein